MSVSSVGSLQSQQQWLTFQSVDSDNDDALSLQEFSAAGQNMPGGIGSLDSSSVQSLFSAKHQAQSSTEMPPIPFWVSKNSVLKMAFSLFV